MLLLLICNVFNPTSNINYSVIIFSYNTFIMVSLVEGEFKIHDCSDSFIIYLQI